MTQIWLILLCDYIEIYLAGFSKFIFVVVILIFLFYVSEYTLNIFRHSRMGHQIPLTMLVINRVIAGNCLGPLEEQSVFLTTKPSLHIVSKWRQVVSIFNLIRRVPLFHMYLHCVTWKNGIRAGSLCTFSGVCCLFSGWDDKLSVIIIGAESWVLGNYGDGELSVGWL
jgi:hypothetical protein